VFAGLASSQTLQVSQGTPPYNSWRLRTRDGGAAPAGFSVTPATADSSRAVVTATAPRDVEATTTHQIEAVVNDSSPGGPAEAVSLAPITFETIPKLSIAGLPERNVVAPGDAVDPELTLRIGVTQASSLQITGRVQATFESSASTPGGSQVTTIPADGAFTIAPACVLPSCGVDIRLRAGSVAGSIRLSGTVQASNQAVTPLLTFPAETLSLPPRVPQLFPPRISVRRISGQQFEICVPGITNTRQMNTAQFEFLAAPGKTLGGGPLSRAVSAEFNQWFTVGGVNAGGAFTLAQPFSMTQGDTSYIGSFVVTLVNSVGTSQRVGPIDFSTAPSCNVNF
ncbi:MAG: hypothetical protein JNN08_03235, partial [Bryobacterales bacterium]|nr:hypothetical protein [Bryobacterales bacterium]